LYDTYKKFVIRNVSYSNIFDVINPSLVPNYEKNCLWNSSVRVEVPVVKDQSFLFIYNAFFECQYAAFLKSRNKT